MAGAQIGKCCKMAPLRMLFVVSDPQFGFGGKTNNKTWMVATIILGAIVGPSVYPRRYKTDTSKRFPRLLSARSLLCVPFPSADFSALTTPLCSGSITGYSILPSSVTYFILWQCTLPHPHAMPYFTPRTRGTSRSNHLHVPIGERPARPVPSTSNAR